MLHVVPELGKRGSSALPRAWRALKGWRRRCPGFSRRPVPFAVWAAVCHSLLAAREPLKAAM
eukprot:9552518-Lingulodinium_polyedra.AAC.1